MQTEWIILSVLVFLVFILIVQVVYVRIKLGRYSNDDYYKQLLVKSEYEKQNEGVCSNISIYAWEIDKSLSMVLNQKEIKAKAQASVKLPEQIYIIPSADGKKQAVTYYPQEFEILALVANPASVRFVNDVAQKKVDYITFGNLLYRVDVVTDYETKISEFLTYANRDALPLLKNKYFVALIPIPSWNQLSMNNFDMINIKKTDISIQGFIASSSPNAIDLSNLPTYLHVIGYRV